MTITIQFLCVVCKTVDDLGPGHHAGPMSHHTGLLSLGHANLRLALGPSHALLTHLEHPALGSWPESSFNINVWDQMSPSQREPL